MNTDTDQVIKEQFAALPTDVQQAIQSVILEARVSDIAKKNGFHIDQIELLRKEVLIFLLGLATPSEFIENLSRELSINRQKATDIANEADRLIFSAIRSSLKKIHAAIAAHEVDEKSKNEITIMTTQAGNEVPIPAKLIEESQQAPVHTGPIPNIRTMPKDIAKIKMGESIRLPKEEIAMNYSADPYREKPE